MNGTNMSHHSMMPNHSMMLNPHGSPIGLESITLSHAFQGLAMFVYGICVWHFSVKRCFTSNELANGPQDLFKSRNIKFIKGLTVTLFSMAGMIVESITVRHGRSYHYAYYPFYAASFVAGLTDVLSAVAGIVFPDQLDTWAYTLPFIFQGYCMRAESAGQPHLTSICHMLTSYLGFAVAMLSVLASLNQSVFIYTWLYCLGVLVEASWLCQSGVVLGPLLSDKWGQTSHYDMMIIVVEFAWHIFFVVLLQLCWALIYARLVGSSFDRVSPSEVVGYAFQRSSAGAKSRANNLTRDHVKYTPLLNSDDSPQRNE